MKLPISKLVNNTGQIEGLPANPRQIDKTDYDRLLKSLKEDPDFLVHKPLHVYEHDDKYVVLGGNQRLRALKELGYKDVPVTVYEPETPVEVLKRRIIIDNSTFGDYDMEMLGNEWSDEPLTDWGVDLPEDWLEQEPEIEEDEAPEVSDEPPVSKLGEVYQLGRHRVMCGDSTDGLNLTQLLDGSDMDLVFTDPPYGIDANKMTMGKGKKQFHRGDSDWDTIAPDVRYLLELAPKVCIWGGNYFTDALPATNDWLCWHKKNDGRSFSEFELAWTNYGTNCRLFSHHWGGEEKQHVTMKPIEVCAWAIKLASDAKTVLDTYLGSGSTLIACEQTDRTCYGMELDPKYVDVIRKRYHKFVTGSDEGWQDATPAI